MNCPNCGKETLPGALFCTGCGGRLDTVEVNEGSSSESNWSGELERTFSGSSNFAVDAEFEIAASSLESNDDVDESRNEAPVSPADQSNFDGASAVAAVQNEVKCENDRQNSILETPSGKANSKPPVKPLSTWSFVWREFVFMVPIINIIVLFIFAFGEGVNKNSRSFARSRLIYMLIAAIIIIALAVMVYIFSDLILDWLRTSFRQWYEAAQ
ncbi:MAG: zinc ribbon domain-containing protein [Christensenellaceae bacterium]|nr:zinc ribbon domain-containing protein [Christensenellaceae bacterium]